MGHRMRVSAGAPGAHAQFDNCGTYWNIFATGANPAPTAPGAHFAATDRPHRNGPTPMGARHPLWVCHRTRLSAGAPGAHTQSDNYGTYWNIFATGPNPAPTAPGAHFAATDRPHRNGPTPLGARHPPWMCHRTRLSAGAPGAHTQFDNYGTCWNIFATGPNPAPTAPGAHFAATDRPHGRDEGGRNGRRCQCNRQHA